VTRFLFWDQALDQLHESFEQNVTTAVKLLLESKHLYQSATLEIKDLLDNTLKSLQDHEHEEFVKSRFYTRVGANWFPVDRAFRRHIHPKPPEEKEKPIRFQTPDVKLFCQTCDRIEAFNSISSEDFLQRDPVSAAFTLSGQIVQVFALSFLCQSCKSVPEVFLVRRQGLKLTNSGRSPIEHVDVPPVIPKSVRTFYSGAVVAHQSGQTLAGIFLLRTLIEQWARSGAPCNQLLADAVLDAYMATLPEDFKSRFPSFRVLYADLSADIHAVKGDTDLFDRARVEIVEHFDARLLFKL
jgi:hypothetical protein